MTNPKQEEEELLILPDEWEDELLITDSNITDTDTPKTDAEPIIDFDITDTTEQKSESEISIENDNETPNLDISLWDEVSQPPKQEENSLDLSSFVEDEKEDTTEKTETAGNGIVDNIFAGDDGGSVTDGWDIWDMSVILSRTISEFNDREEVISSDISTTDATIKKLEADLKTKNQELSDLKKEKTALETNRKTLETMKNNFESKSVKKVTKK